MFSALSSLRKVTLSVIRIGEEKEPFLRRLRPRRNRRSQCGGAGELLSTVRRVIALVFISI